MRAEVVSRDSSELEPLRRRIEGWRRSRPKRRAMPEDRSVLGCNPLDGAVCVFRNRSGRTLKLLAYDGQGYWLCTKRMSKGKFKHWPVATLA